MSAGRKGTMPFLGEPMLGCATPTQGHPVRGRHRHGTLQKQGDVSSTTLTAAECLDAGLRDFPEPECDQWAAGGWEGGPAEELKRKGICREPEGTWCGHWAGPGSVGAGPQGGFLSDNPAQETTCNWGQGDEAGEGAEKGRKARWRRPRRNRRGAWALGPVAWERRRFQWRDKAISSPGPRAAQR